MFRSRLLQVVGARAAAVLMPAMAMSAHLAAAHTAEQNPRPFSELSPLATVHVGKTADWVAIVPGAVWVGSTGPFAVHRIDPKSNRLVATVILPGEPCAGLAVGFGSLWIPLCGDSPALARVNLASDALLSVAKLGAVMAEGGVTTSADSVWLIVDKAGALARISPHTGGVRQTVRVPPGSYNPLYAQGKIWVSRVEGAEVTIIDALTGTRVGTASTGPHPRFLAAGGGAVWTLNQGDGSLTRIDTRSLATSSIALGTPGHGGDIKFGAGRIWTTIANMPLSMVDASSASLRCRWSGAGGDSLDVGADAIWLTDYHGGTISRIALDDVLRRCQQ